MVGLPPAAAQQPDGVWRSQGYGYVFDIRGTALKAFEVTTRTCVAGFTAKGTTAEATFKARGGEVLVVKPGLDNDHKLLSNFRIERLPQMPAVCDPPTANTPLGNFEVFTRTWAEHYIAFGLKHVDWDKVVAENRPKVTAQTLFAVLAGMIKPFNDIHTDIEARNPKREFNGPFRPGSDRVMKGGFGKFEKRGRRELFAVTDQAWLHGSLRQFCNGQVQYGHIDKATGYIRILAFGGYVRHGDFAKGLAALDAALDEIFSDPALAALVIDMRLSFGGDDKNGLAIASRLTAKEYLAYTKQARDRDKWTPADPVMVRPSARPGFHGPVVELIGPITMSAAETFTQALMGRSTHVTRIGENTQGVFSDVLDRRLPNGWTFGLPNEVYRTVEGRAFDVEGIPPDITVPVFADDDVGAGTDPGMMKAVEILSSGK